jgi:hypothetical protein
MCAFAQQWLQIRGSENEHTFLRIDVSPESPRNEATFWTGWTVDAGKKKMKAYSYKTPPSYEEKTYAFNDNFDSIAVRSYELFDVNDKSLYKDFHGFLTFDAITSENLSYSYSLWACLLKTYGANACYYASQTQFENQKAEWVKFSKDENMERYIRVDQYGATDSIVMFKMVYRPSFAKQVKGYFSEIPVERYVAAKIYNNGGKILELAESWMGKKKAVSTIWLYPKNDPVDVANTVFQQYVEWALLLLGQGKDAVIEKSNAEFGKIVK